MSINKLDDLLNINYEKKMRLAIVSAHDEEVLEAVVEAMELGIIDPILIGNEKNPRNFSKEKFKS